MSADGPGPLSPEELRAMLQVADILQAHGHHAVSVGLLEVAERGR